jgi:hypothetical protein
MMAGFLELDRENWLPSYRKAVITVGSMLLAAACSIMPVHAKPPQAGIWVDLHFAGANGRTRTVVEPLQIVRADAAQAECSNQPGLDVLAKVAIEDEPALANMTLASASCETDKSGAIKIAIGGWPAGKGPSDKMPPGWAPKATPALLDGPPAVVMLVQVASNGKLVKTVVGYDDGIPAFYTKTCSARLTQELPDILNKAQIWRQRIAETGRVKPFDINALKLKSASCVPFPKNMGELMGSAGTVDYALMYKN